MVFFSRRPVPSTLDYLKVTAASGELFDLARSRSHFSQVTRDYDVTR
jgi:hypothetical protein